jgi:hypothetical protein
LLRLPPNASEKDEFDRFVADLAAAASAAREINSAPGSDAA